MARSTSANLYELGVTIGTISLTPVLPRREVLIPGEIMAFGTFTVHAGDFKKCSDHQYVAGKLLMKNEGMFIREDILVSEVEQLEIASEESVKAWEVWSVGA